MKHLTVGILMNVVILLFLSCRTLDPAKKYPNMVADMDPFSVGTAEAQFDRFLSSKVNKAEIEAIFYPRLNAVSLEFKYDFIKYRLFWDEKARNLFVASLDLYKKDFEDRKLADNYRKTRAVYGKTAGRLEWEVIKFTKTRISNPVIEIGYRFKENTPFFATFTRAAKEITKDEETSNAVNSQQINMYFTRAQADELAGLFDQAKLMELVGLKTGAATGDPDDPDAPQAEPEPYREYGGR